MGTRCLALLLLALLAAPPALAASPNTAYTSQNGTDWVRGGTWTHALPHPRIALVAMGGGGDFTAEFDSVRVSALRAGERAR